MVFAQLQCFFEEQSEERQFQNLEI